MPAVIISILTWVLGSAIGRLLVGAGLTLLTAGGVYTLVRSALDSLSGYFSSVPYSILQFVILCLGWF